ncbi:transcriptional regulator [Gordonia sp. PDNC005]|uniref:transcriptional regulator n=1 Tax=unclassified Gordonia (in: high G+C Gram-positive bacteria) TaxID=2657482 RepID=UPI0019644E45|nr:transcriptional regulator [Gordonia sp. PDNC005]QRY64226.1 transcriptional regulator [Gordonia sp. PDNC005]
MHEPRFDPVIHAPARLRICAIAASSSYVEFGELQKRLELSKSALSKQVSQLTEAGYLSEEYVTRAGRSRLRLALTDEGLRAYRDHVRALKGIIDSPAPAEEHERPEASRSDAGSGIE